MFCWKCGRENSEGSSFCTGCGSSLKAPENIQGSGYAESGAYRKVKPRKTKLIACILIAFAVIAGAVAALVITAGSDPQAGNTAGNIANDGIAAQQDGWIYYTNMSDNFSLYKIRSDGTDKARLNDTESHYINVSGGWVYYVSQNCIRKIKTDGTEETDLVQSKAYYMDVSVIGGWIYYINYDVQKRISYIYKMRTDGGEKGKVCEDQAQSLTLYAGWIYFENLNDNNALYKIRTDGTGKKKLTDTEAVAFINVEGDWVYFKSRSGISKIKTDGSAETVVKNTNQNGVKLLQCMNVSGGWIYYSLKTLDNTDSLSRMRIDGTGDTQLYGKSVQFINIVSDWIYYSGAGIYRMKTDGTENQQVD
jgi:phage pi2 protein 07